MNFIQFIHTGNSSMIFLSTLGFFFTCDHAPDPNLVMLPNETEKNSVQHSPFFPPSNRRSEKAPPAFDLEPSVEMNTAAGPKGETSRVASTSHGCRQTLNFWRIACQSPWLLHDIFVTRHVSPLKFRVICR